MTPLSARALILPALAAISALFLSACGDSETSRTESGATARENNAALELAERARTFYDAGDFPSAIEKYVEAAKAFEARPAENSTILATIHSQLGDAYYRVGKPIESVAALRKAQDAARIAYPANSIENIRVSVLLGRLLVDVGRHEEAIGVLTTARQLLPANSTDENVVILDLVSLEACADASMALENAGETVARLEAYLGACEGKLGFNHERTGKAFAKAAGYFNARGEFDVAAQLYQKAIQSFEQSAGKDDPLVGDQLVSIGWIVLDHYLDSETAGTIFARALEIYRSQTNPSREPLFRALEGTTTIALGGGTTPEEQAQYVESLALAKDLHGPDSPHAIKAQALYAMNLLRQKQDDAAREQIAALTALRDGQPAMREGAYIEAFDFVGIALQFMGEAQAGGRILEENLKQLQSTVGTGAPEFDRSALRLAWFHVRMGQLLESDRYFALVYESAAAALGERHRRTSNVAYFLGETRRAASNFEDAEKLYRSALAANMEIFGSDHQKTNRARHCLGLSLGELRRYDEAIAVFSENLELQRKTRGDSHNDCLLSEANIAWMLYQKEDFSESKDLCLKALERSENASEPNIYGRAELFHHLARAQLALGEYASAATAAENALAAFSGILPPTHSDIARVRTELGRAYTQLDRGADAERELMEAFESAKANHGEMSLPVAKITSALAILYSKTGHYEVADDRYEDTISIETRTYGEDGEAVIDSHLAYADSLFERSEFKRAADRYRIAFDIAGHVHGPGSYPAVRAKLSLASALSRFEEKDEARKLLDDVRKTLAADEIEFPARRIFDIRIGLSTVFHQLGDSTESEAESKKAVALTESHPEIREKVVLALVGLSNTATNRKDYREAQARAREALKIAEESDDATGRLRLSAHAALSTALHDDGKHEESLAESVKALEIARETLGEKNPLLLDYLKGVAITRFRSGETKKATEGLIECYLLARNIYGEEHAVTDSHRANLAAAHFESNRFEEALDLYQQSLTFREKQYGNSRKTLVILDALSLLYWTMAEYPKAAEHTRRAIAILVELEGDKSAAVADRYEDLGNDYFKMANRPRALEFWEQALNRYNSLGIKSTAVTNLRANIDSVRKQLRR